MLPSTGTRTIAILVSTILFICIHCQNAFTISPIAATQPKSCTSIGSTNEEALIDDLWQTSDRDTDTDRDLGRPSTSIRYRCRVAYDGTGFSGFQLQGEKRTIQGVLETVLQRRFGRTIRVVGAGRTDAGVHARGQAIHFDLSLEEHSRLITLTEQASLERSMNRMLPADVRVWHLGMAPPPSTEFVNNQTSVFSWNVMRKCDSKLYSYRLCLGDAMDPILRYDRWQLDNNWGPDVDPSRLSSILQEYEGTHDFVCFAGSLEATARKTGVIMSTIRTVYSCKLICEDPDQKLYRIDIYLDGAMYKMVRNLVGTAIDVCRGVLPRETFDKLLKEPSKHGFSRDNNPCKPAPPQGLTLERVFYPHDDF